MKETIVDILEGILGLFIVVVTIAGFIVFGNANPFGGFSFGLALLGGIVSLLFAILSSGLVYVLLVIRDQQEEQIRLLRQIEKDLVSSGSSGPQSISTRSSSGLSSPRVGTQSNLRRCHRCNTILSSGASECQSCGAPVST